jgi:hypothetical protein
MFDFQWFHVCTKSVLQKGKDLQICFLVALYKQPCTWAGLRAKSTLLEYCCSLLLVAAPALIPAANLLIFRSHFKRHPNPSCTFPRWIAPSCASSLKSTGPPLCYLLGRYATVSGLASTSTRRRGEAGSHPIVNRRVMDQVGTNVPAPSTSLNASSSVYGTGLSFGGRRGRRHPKPWRRHRRVEISYPCKRVGTRFHIHSARSYKCIIKTLDIISRHD